MANIPVHFKLSEMLLELMRKGKTRKTTHESIKDGHFQLTSGSNQFFIDQPITILDRNIYDDLPIAAIKIILLIHKDLEINNPIWECKDNDKRETKAAIVHLKRKEILIPISGTDLYIVNPEKIRRGKSLSGLAAIYDYSKRKYDRDHRWRISAVDIKRLNVPESLDIFDHDAESVMTINIEDETHESISLTQILEREKVQDMEEDIWSYE